MNDSSKDAAQQCDHKPAYKIPEWENSSSLYVPEKFSKYSLNNGITHTTEQKQKIKHQM